MLNQKDVWKKFKTLNVLYLENYTFIQEFLKSFFEMDILFELDLKIYSKMILLVNKLEYLILLKKIDLNQLKKISKSKKSLIFL